MCRRRRRDFAVLLPGLDTPGEGARPAAAAAPDPGRCGRGARRRRRATACWSRSPVATRWTQSPRPADDRCGGGLPPARRRRGDAAPAGGRRPVRRPPVRPAARRCGTETLERSDTRRLALAGELRRLLDGATGCGALEVHYQPTVALADGELVGAEALVRWEHPVHGLLPPDEFIGMAERTGLVAPLTRYVLARALERCAAWEASGLTLRHLGQPQPAGALRARLPAHVRGGAARRRAAAGPAHPRAHRVRRS